MDRAEQMLRRVYGERVKQWVPFDPPKKGSEADLFLGYDTLNQRDVLVKLFHHDAAEKAATQMNFLNRVGEHGPQVYDEGVPEILPLEYLKGYDTLEQYGKQHKSEFVADPARRVAFAEAVVRARDSFKGPAQRSGDQSGHNAMVKTDDTYLPTDYRHYKIKFLEGASKPQTVLGPESDIASKRAAADYDVNQLFGRWKTAGGWLKAIEPAKKRARQ